MLRNKHAKSFTKQHFKKTIRRVGTLQRRLARIRYPKIMNPEHLYKYRPIDAKSLRILSCNEMYFSSPDDFNDPFDCNIVPKLNITLNEMEEFLRKERPGETNEFYSQFAVKYLDKYPEMLTNSLAVEFDRIRKNLRFCCFSEINNSSLMFSHYADGHKGICLEFKVNSDSFYDFIMPVQYPIEYPTIDFFKKDYKAMMNAEMLTKRQEWSYEKEWRIIKIEASEKFYSFPLDALSGIIFGLRTSEEDITMIHKIVSNRSLTLNFYKCEKQINSYDLKIVKI